MIIQKVFIVEQLKSDECKKVSKSEYAWMHKYDLLEKFGINWNRGFGRESVTFPQKAIEFWLKILFPNLTIEGNNHMYQFELDIYIHEIKVGIE